MIEVYRLSSGRFPPSSGKGAALRGGRWNPSGTEVIYTASSRPLAVLEVLAHYAVLPLDFVITAVRIPDRIKVADAPVSRLPANWNDPSSSVEITQRIGARWIASGRSCVLLVPSAVVAKEWNYVLNVAHPDFMFIEFGVPEPFRFDPRLR